MAKVLVVDDSKVDQSLVAGILSPKHDIDVMLASTGVEAMSCVRESAPDLVLTDLMMPEMDGLDLVKHVRQDHPSVPVIVMTAASSAETAIQALQVGAASFVPKSRMSDRLYQTVRQVLTLKQAMHPYGDVIECLENADIEFRLRSEIDLIPQFIDLVQRTTSCLRICDTTEAIRLSLALEEALLNALVHGNLELTEQLAGKGIHPRSEPYKSRASEEPYRSRSIFVRLQISAVGVTFAVRDEGGGFNIGSLPSDDDLRTFQDGAGRGVRLMRSFMDDVQYNDSGNMVQMRRNFAT